MSVIEATLEGRQLRTMSAKDIPGMSIHVVPTRKISHPNGPTELGIYEVCLTDM